MSVTESSYLNMPFDLYGTSLAALEPGVLFGLATFSHKIGLYDVQGPVPVVKNVIIPPELDGHIPVDLEDAMPLSSFLAPVCCIHLFFLHCYTAHVLGLC